MIHSTVALNGFLAKLECQINGMKSGCVDVMQATSCEIGSDCVYKRVCILACGELSVTHLCVAL